MTKAGSEPLAVSTYARRTARAVHLWGLANALFSFAGLIAALAILRINRNEPFVRAHARTALNMQLTWLLFAISAFGVYLVSVAHDGGAIRPGDVESGALLARKAYWHALWIFGIIVASMVATIVLNVAGAVAASRGLRYRYPLAFPFVRPKKR